MNSPYQNYDPYSAPQDMFAIDAALSERLAFLRKVYIHVFGAILLMVGIIFCLFQTGANMALLQMMAGSWWISLFVFMGVSWIAQKLAFSGASTATQYVGLGLYSGVQALITTPILTFAMRFNPDLIGQAAFATVLLTGGLTLFVLVSKKDFSFLGGALWVAGLSLFALSLGACFFGFSLGLGLSVGIIALMCGYILYETSMIMNHLPTSAHVAGALMIFGSIATLFREILYLLLRFNEE